MSALSFSGFVFYAFAAILIFAALRVITVKNPVHAALFLVLAFFSASALWMVMKAEFLAVTLVLVYVGAVMVLFLFVVMMLDINVEALRERFRQAVPAGIIVGILIVFEMVLVLLNAMKRGPTTIGADAGGAASNTSALASVLYTKYVYVFELAAVVLLVAIVAAIALTLRKRGESRVQDVSDQVKVKREDRVRLLKIPSHKREQIAEATSATEVPVAAVDATKKVGA